MATIDDRINTLTAAVESLAKTVGKKTTGAEASGLTARDRGEDIGQLEAIRDLYNEIGGSATAAAEARQAEFDIISQKIIATRKKMDVTINQGRLDAHESALKELEALEKEKEALEEINKRILRSKDSAESLSQTFSKMFTGTAPDPKSLLNVKNLADIGSKLKDIDAGWKAGNLKYWTTAVGLATAVVTQFTQSIINLAIDLYDMEAGFMKATGANREFARSVTESYGRTREFGVTAKETSAAAQSLYTTFTDFTFASKEQRDSLIDTGAILARTGIGHQDFAKSVQISTKALGMGTKEAGQNMVDLEKFAENLGVAPQEMARNFAGAGNMMAKMGVQGVDAFKDLAIASKVTGMEMEKILRITDKFDTFEGAAEMAGKLNAAIGGNFVNAMDLMMTTDPAERFGMIRDSLSNAGLEFDNMSYYQKKFFAESMGLSDVNELALIMSDNIGLVTGATKESTQSIKEAAERARDMATFQENLNMAFVQMIPILTPLIDKFVEFTKWLGENSDAVVTLAKSLVILGVLVKLGQGIMFISKALAIWRAATIATTTAQTVATVGTYSWAGAFAALNLSTGGLLFALGAIAAAVALLITWLFTKDVSASTFLEGLAKIAHVFKDIAIAVFETLNPITQMTKLIDALGSLISGVLSGITGLFTALTAPEAAENIMKIGKAITDIPMRKNIEFAASMTAAAAAAVAGRALATVAPAATTTAGRTGEAPHTPGRTIEKVRQPISIDLRGEKLADFVVEVVGEKIHAVNFE